MNTSTPYSMTTFAKSLLTAIVLALSLSNSAIAQKPEPLADAGDGLRIATGKKGKGYSKLFADIRAVCGAQVAITEVETEAALSNDQVSSSHVEHGAIRTGHFSGRRIGGFFDVLVIILVDQIGIIVIGPITPARNLNGGFHQPAAIAGPIRYPCPSAQTE